MVDLKYVCANVKKYQIYDQGYQLLGDRKSDSKLNSSFFTSSSSDTCYRFVFIREGKKSFGILILSKKNIQLLICKIVFCLLSKGIKYFSCPV